MKNLPNVITSFRIIGTLFLYVFSPISPAFYVVYTLCGLSDVLDGMLARKLNATSDFGTKLDTVADLFFYVTMVIRIFPILLEVLPTWVWILSWSIVALRLVSYTVAAIKYKKFSSMHTYMNKVSGLGMFSIPYLVKLPFGDVGCTVVALITGVASVEEFLMHLTRKEYTEDRKTILKI